MKECGLKVVFLGFLCSLLPFIANAKEFLIDAENDPLILKLAIALLIVSIIFLVCVIVVLVFVYKTIKNTEGIERKNYQVSYQQSKADANWTNPFDGHAMYSRRTATLYLPGRENYGNNPSNIFTVQPKQREDSNLVYQESRVIRDSPPPEKGQRDSMVSEKTTRRRAQDETSYENETYAATNSGFYELTISKTYKER